MSTLYIGFKKIAYFIINIVTLGRGVTTKINGVKLKLPTKYFRLFPSNYERSNFDFFKKYITPGSTILDIGAHIGIFSIFFAKLSQGKVFSFEPTPFTLKLLRKTIDINKYNDIITVIPAAVSERSGKARFFISETSAISVANSLIGYEENNFDLRNGSYEVDVISIDEFVKIHSIRPLALKIDAEGVELELLKGASQTFISCRPYATLGIHLFAYKNKVETLSAIWDLLLEYKMKVILDGETITRDIFCNKEGHVFDVQLIPE